MDVFELAKNSNKNPYAWVNAKPFFNQLSKAKYYKSTNNLFVIVLYEAYFQNI